MMMWGLTPSLSQPVKFLGCKVHTYTMENSIFDGPTFNTVHFDRNPVTYSRTGGGGGEALMISNLALLLFVF